MRKTLTRLGNSEALVITREMKELAGIGSEVEAPVPGKAIVITAAQDAQRSETPQRQAQFAAARDQSLEEYDEVFHRLADA